MEEQKMKKVLLYSGGMDSWLINKLEKPDVRLFIDLGTDSTRGEQTKLDPDVIKFPLTDLGKLERKETDFILPLRNLYLIATATNYGEHIILGATKTDATYDKTYEFAEKLEDLLNYMWLPQKWTPGKKIKVDVHYREYTKSDLLRMFMEQGGSWEEAYEKSYSCYKTTPEGHECHNCRPCFLKMMAFIDNGIDLGKERLQEYLPYINSKLEEYKDVWGDRLYSREDYEKVKRMAEE